MRDEKLKFLYPQKFGAGGGKTTGGIPPIAKSALMILLLNIDRFEKQLR